MAGEASTHAQARSDSVGAKPAVPGAPIQFGSLNPSVLGAAQGRPTKEGSEATPSMHQPQGMQQRQVPPYHSAMAQAPFVPHSIPMMSQPGGPPSPYIRGGPAHMTQPMYHVHGSGGMSMPPPHMPMSQSGGVPVTIKAPLEKPKSKVLKIVNPDTKEEVTISRPKASDLNKEDTGKTQQPSAISKPEIQQPPLHAPTASKSQVPPTIVPARQNVTGSGDVDVRPQVNFAQVAKTMPEAVKPSLPSESGQVQNQSHVAGGKSISSTTGPGTKKVASVPGTAVAVPKQLEQDDDARQRMIQPPVAAIKPPSFAAAASKQPAVVPVAPSVVKPIANKQQAASTKDAGKDHVKEKGDRRRERNERHDRADRADRRTSERGGKGREKQGSETRKEIRTMEKNVHADRSSQPPGGGSGPNITAPLAQGAWKQGSAAHIMRQHAEKKYSEDSATPVLRQHGSTDTDSRSKEGAKKKLHEGHKKKSDEESKPAQRGKPSNQVEKKERAGHDKGASERSQKLVFEKAALPHRSVVDKAAAAEKLAAEKAAAEKLAAEKLAAEKLAAEKAAEKIAAEKLALERKEADRKAMAEKAAAVRAIAEKASLKAAMAVSGEMQKSSVQSAPSVMLEPTKPESTLAVDHKKASTSTSTANEALEKAQKNSGYYSTEFLLSFRERCTSLNASLPPELVILNSSDGATGSGPSHGLRDDTNRWGRGSGSGRRGVPPIPGMPGSSRGGQGSRRGGGSGVDKWERGKSLPSSKDSGGPTPAVHKAKNAYKIGAVTDEMEAKKRQIMSILNKLTPQNFDKLIAKLKEIEYTDAHTLNALIDEIFEKALSEPTFCGMYAGACQCLAEDMPTFLNEETGQEITFKAVLLGKCELEFKGEEPPRSPVTESVEDRDSKEGVNSEIDKDESQKEGKEDGELVQKLLTEEEKAKEEAKKVLQLEEEKRKAKHRMLGNIRFIGELFKKEMLTKSIMHGCIQKLLGDIENPDEEDVEALCKLMTTIGEQLDQPEARKHMIAYFQRIEALSENHNISSRVRFMLKDLIELRMDNWKHRRVVEGPKKIDEVHRDAKMQAAGSGGGFGRDSMRRGGSSRRDERRGSDFGPPSGRGPPMGSMFERSGPPSGRFGRSGSGTQARRSADSDGPPRAMNREEVMSKIPSAASLPLRPGGPMMSHARGGTDNVSLRPSALTGAIAGATRAAVAAPDAEGVVPATQSPDDQKEKISSESKVGREPAQQPQSATSLSEERMKQKSKALAEEFYGARDRSEAKLCVEEIRAANAAFIPQMIEQWLLDGLESKGRDWAIVFELFQVLLEVTPGKGSTITGKEALSGLRLLLNQMEDLSLDVPLAPKHIGRLAGQLCALDGTFKFIDLVEEIKVAGFEGEEEGQLIDAFLAADIVATALAGFMSVAGFDAASEVWKDSQVDIADLLPDTVKSSEESTQSEVEKITSKYGIKSLMDGGCAMEDFVRDALKNKMDPVALADWLEANADSLPESSAFSYRIAKLVIDSVVEGAQSNEENSRQEWPEELPALVDAERGYWRFLKKLFGHLDCTGQLPCVRAAETCFGEYKCPPGLMKRLLMDLFYTDVLTEETFTVWREGENEDSEVYKKAMADASPWLEWLAEQEEIDSDEEESAEQEQKAA